MSFCAKIGAVLLLVLAVGCQEVPRYWGGGRVVLAEAAGRKLYAREVKAAIPKGVVGEDSVAFVNRYVEKWVHKQLKLHEAEELFSDAEQDIDSLVEEYRQALLIRKFDQHLIEERIDTLVTADQIAAEAEFFSFGTNDLTQYTLACDRQNNDLGRFYDPHNPAVLRLLKMVTENAHKNGIWVGICGELGADLTLTETFLAIGVDELSVSPRAVLPLRNAVRMTDTRESAPRLLAAIDAEYPETL